MAHAAVTLTNVSPCCDVQPQYSIDPKDSGFSLDPGNCVYPIKKGQPCVLWVSFVPSQPGASRGSLWIRPNTVDPPLMIALSGNGQTPCPANCASNRWWCGSSGAVIVLLAYWILVIVVAANVVVEPTREWLKEEIGSARVEVESTQLQVPTVELGKDTTSAPVRFVADHDGGIRDKILGLLRCASALVEDKKQKDDKWIQSSFDWFLNRLFLTRGNELAAWGYVHSAYVELAKYLPERMAEAWLKTAQADLQAQQQDSEADNGTLRALAGRIEQYFDQKRISEFNQLFVPPYPLRHESYGPLLSDALLAIYTVKDDHFSAISGIYNKVIWLIFWSLFLIGVLTLAFHTGHIFLVGACGGILSRLSRVLEGKKAASDFRVWWTSIFLSPVAGALGAWAGILLLKLGAATRLVGWPTDHLDWTDACDFWLLAIALVLGYSERLFGNLISKYENISIDQGRVG